MESIFLVNPRRKKRRKGRMPAGLARYWASRRSGGKTRKRRRKARAVMANPRRRRRHARVHRRARRRNPIFSAPKRHRRRARAVFRRSRRRHRNPFSVSGLKGQLMPAAIGAGGAIALQIAYGYATPYLPAQLQTGYLPALVKLAGAIGLGMVAGKFLGREKGKEVTLGGLTVVLVGVITPLIAQAVPSLGLSGFGGGDYIPYSRPGVGAYMRNPKAMGRLGFMSPAGVIPPRGMGAYMARSVPGMKGLDDMQGGSGYNWSNDGM